MKKTIDNWNIRSWKQRAVWSVSVLLAFVVSNGINIVCTLVLPTGARTVQSSSDPDTQDDVVGLLESAPPFSFYVYDSVPYNLTPRALSECIERRMKGPSRCGWALDVCTETFPDNHAYRTRRLNYNADVVLADLFLRYPVADDADSHHNGNGTTVVPVTAHFAKRTNDPRQADVFVVPYAHDSHCKLS